MPRRNASVLLAVVCLLVTGAAGSLGVLAGLVHGPDTRAASARAASARTENLLPGFERELGGTVSVGATTDSAVSPPEDRGSESVSLAVGAPVSIAQAAPNPDAPTVAGCPITGFCRR